ncbi:glycoside hydrolase family 3 protein [Photobacterium phosphoreum]|uniref:glycoside hydrolase family 3 protein n=1 Tax=Photobacterium phosphoreum TaxID=659 RepID=UPI001E4825F9|nr:glycoside hydrolase family 3 N-terminal domain-containing protein [Photobacterium phosphoreum]MCD9502996.1 glycoside hydrolase family 3 protein [Photobacterium phosphoreum]
MKVSLFTLTPIAAVFFIAGCNSDSIKDNSQQPTIKSKVHKILTIDNKEFRDSNGNRLLEPYEDWRLTPEQRAIDLVSRMNLEEKTGMMMIDTLNADPYGKLPENANKYINIEKMTRFIFRNPVVAEPNREIIGERSGAEITPEEAATFMNKMQEIAENTTHGIPILFKSNARNHIDPTAKAGINVTSGAFSSWPKEAGLAATRDMTLIKKFAQIMNEEWSSIGLRSMYGYMMDLATEPRWYRVHETFTEDANLAADIMKSLIQGLQGDTLNEHSIALTIKHFPGGGPQEDGGDPHYDFGKNQVYQGNNFDYHLIPFIAAIDAGASSIMPYYGIPIDQAVIPNNVGMSFSKGIVTELLRDKLQFKGYVNTDTGIIGDRAWGLEGLTEQQQIAIAIDAGSDILSGYHNNQTILDVVKSKNLTENRINLSVQRLLKEQFQLGLFENAYVDPAIAKNTLGKQEYQELALEAQRKSVVLLDNKIVSNNATLPLLTTTEKPLKLYTINLDRNIISQAGFSVISDNITKNNTKLSIPTDIDYALLRIFVTNEGARPDLYFGGSNPEELSILDFTGMEAASSWKISPSLKQIKEVMNKIGANKTILAINFRQPFVLDEESGMKDAGATLATFGVSDSALIDIITGKFNPQGKLPFALADTVGAIERQYSDTPGYHPDDTLYPFGWGLSYK